MLSRIRRVTNPCTTDHDCAVKCTDGEVAVNAFCPKKAPAILTSEQDVSCGTGNNGTMIAYCAR